MSITCTRKSLALTAWASATAWRTAASAVCEPSIGTRICLYMRVSFSRCRGRPESRPSRRGWDSGVLEAPAAEGQHQRVAPARALHRLDWRGLVDHARIVQEQQRPGLGQREALAVGALGLEHAG